MEGNEEHKIDSNSEAPTGMIQRSLNSRFDWKRQSLGSNKYSANLPKPRRVYPSSQPNLCITVQSRKDSIRSMRFVDQKFTTISNIYYNNPSTSGGTMGKVSDRTQLGLTDCKSGSVGRNGAEFHQNESNDVDVQLPCTQEEKICNEQLGFGFKKLSDLSEMNPEKLLASFGLESDNLDAFLKGNISSNLDMIVLFVKCLSKLTAVQFDMNKIDVLILVCKSKFIDVLQKYVMRLPYTNVENREHNLLLWNDCEMFFKNMLTFLEAVVDLTPSTAVDTFRKLFNSIKISLEGLQKCHKKIFSEDVLKNFQDIQVKLAVYNVYIEEEDNKMAEHRSTKTKPDDDWLPPNNFRDIHIMPSKEDLFREPNFLRPNIVDGAYKSVEHYLDVQFRLMREDFIAPLRDAFKMYNESNDRRKQVGASFYRHAKLLRYLLKGGELVVEVCYDKKVYESKYKNNRMTNSKRFIYGSLLCLTCDNFETILFCTVHNRDDIGSGKIAVEMTSPVTNDMFGKAYVLIESETYFPPYLHVLKALQNPTLLTNFPFEDYIIRAKACETPPPYLQHETRYKLFNGTSVVLNDDSSWPSSDNLGLDETQYAAYKMALFREFVTIQGPPGTGKTFIGLKIAETLLMNLYMTSSFCSPILVVCYTNHALDQFLEGLLSITDKLVRIGGQSKNEFIQKYNLNNLQHSDMQYCYIKRNLKNYKKDIEFLQVLSNSLQSRDHICDIVNNPRLRVYLLNLDINLECFLMNYTDPEQPSLVSWLLLSDLQDFSRNNKFFKKASQTNIPVNSDAQEMNPVFEEVMDSPMQEEVRNYEFSCHDLKIRKGRFLSSLKSDNLPPWKRQTLTQQLCCLEHEMKHLRVRLLRGNSGYCEVNFRRGMEAHHYSADERWSLYWRWLEQLQTCVMEHLVQSMARYREEKIQSDKKSQALDLRILKNAHVVGVTTSGAARLQSQLRSLRPPIVIVEEAAEVMESHVVVSVTKDCEHLIMIGDHQQLRPKTATYRMAKKFNLDISLFERMHKIGTHCCQLGVQHRMRPEIAKLITPAIYEKLKNNSNVESYPNVKGVLKNLYFIDHTAPEAVVEDIASHMNDHEGKFILNLAKYFIQQGYSPDEITILVTYSGQMFYLRREAKTMSLLDGVKINVLDNFQGEENKIILLSLVRSNPEGKIGFLVDDNRVCVALSRAREGFYVMGNMSILKTKSQLWNSVNNTLMELDSIGPILMLRCENHQDVHTPVQTAQDFAKVPEGGCKMICGKLMDCEHHCKSLCHPSDRFHRVVKCKEKCKRIICDSGHDCPLMCYQPCIKSCRRPVKRKLNCDHEFDMECNSDYKEYKCKKVKLSVELPQCHHQGFRYCYQDLKDVICEEPCLQRLACGHACKLKCHTRRDPDHLEYTCREKCARSNKDCPDNHQCDKLCYVECSPCQVLVEKQRSCGHSEEIKCMADPDKIQCTNKCLKTLPCGHPCGGLCQEPCSQEKCEELVSNPFASFCKHDFKIPCLKTLHNTKTGPVLTMEYCQQPCGVRLSCDHMCRGTCGQCAGGRLHMSCSEPCGFTLVCGHSCNEPCREACPPCKKKCEVRCKHSRCPLPCGVPCSMCKHPCPRRCIHGKCTKYCGEDCDITQCSEACSKRLACSHTCRGLCGEQCPPICEICKPDQFPEIFFGNEDDKDAKFIQLIDCRHVLEVSGLDKWMQPDPDGKILVKTCPHCKTPIINTPRYSNNVKQSQRNIDAAKKKLFGDCQENIKNLDNLDKDILLFGETASSKVQEDWLWLFKSLKTRVHKNIAFKEKQILKLSSSEINNLRFMFETLKKLHDFYTSKQISESMIIDHLISIILKAIKRCGYNISQQQSQDLNSEILRLDRIIDITHTEEQSRFTNIKNKSDLDNLKTRIISSLEPFDKDKNKTVFEELNNIRKLISLTPLTKIERDMIVRVMNFKQGHWYICPNGHPYCITECGRPMERSVCPECKTVIGGEDHRLVSGNQLASFMDGAA